MNFELSGKLIEKYDIVNVSESFKKREFVVETSETNGSMTFNEQIKFQLTRDKCDIIDSFNINDPVRVFFNIKGRRWEKDGKVSYFNNLDVWKIDAVNNSSNSRIDDIPLPDEPASQIADEEDEVPF